MGVQSDHVRVTTEPGIATLWLAFPGEPVNALDLARLRELDRALAAVEANPSVDVLVVRSANPAGFSAGVHPAALASLAAGADRGAFAWAGQRVFARLAGAAAVSVAVLDGPCLGAGLELALACDYRLCLTRPATLLGFPDAPRGVRPCFGGTVWPRGRAARRAVDALVASGRTLSGREARAAGLVDHAFCDRRCKIELRTFLDGLERRGVRPRQAPEGVGLARERRAFADALGTPAAQGAVRRHLAALAPPREFPAPVNPVPPFPAVVGLVGDDAEAARLAADAALRGGGVVVCGDAGGVRAAIAAALARGFVTPLEADQALARVTVAGGPAGLARAGLVLAAGGGGIDRLARVVGPGCVVATGGGGADGLGRGFPPPRRVVRIRFGPEVELVAGAGTDADAVHALAAWLGHLGRAGRVVAPGAEAAPAAA